MKYNGYTDKESKNDPPVIHTMKLRYHLDDNLDDNDVIPTRRNHVPMHTEFDDTSSFTSNQYLKKSKHPNIRNVAETDYKVIKGMIYMDFLVGTPSQLITLSASLNSDYTVFPCTSDCPGSVCGKTNKIAFEKSWSDTFKPLYCYQCFDDGTAICKDKSCHVEGYVLSDENIWTAYEAKDIFSTGMIDFELMFGCMSSTAEYIDEIGSTSNGILGLSFAKTSFTRQFYNSGKILGSFFSMCFHRYDDQDLNNAGTISFGGMDTTYHRAAPVFFKNTRVGSNYSVDITGVYLREGGGESVKPKNSWQTLVALEFDKEALSNAPAGHVIDTTSFSTILNKAIQESFLTEWEKLTGWAYTYNPIELSYSELLELPTVLIQLKTSWSTNNIDNPDKTLGMVGTFIDPSSPFDVLIAIPATNYMQQTSNGMYKTTLSLKHGTGSILGSNAFQGRHMLFDLVSPRIGITETERCDDSNIPDLSTFLDKPSPKVPTKPTSSTVTPPTKAPIGKSPPQPTMKPSISSSPTSRYDTAAFRMLLEQNPKSFDYLPAEIGGACAAVGLGIIIIVIWCCRRKGGTKKRKRRSSDKKTNNEAFDDDPTVFVPQF